MNRYQIELPALLTSAWPEIGATHKLEFKNVFGAAGGYADGKLFCSFGKFGLALKLPPDHIETLMAQGGKPLRYFEKGHIKKAYVVLPAAVLNAPGRLKKLLNASIEFATGL